MATRKTAPQRRVAAAKKSAVHHRKLLNGEFKSFACGLLCIIITLIGLAMQGGCSSSDDNQSAPSPATGDNNPTAPQHYEGLQNVATNPILKDTEVTLDNYTAIRGSFNSSAHQPNWISWELTRERTSGSAKRDDFQFLNDPRVYGCPTTSDYTRSGYDRGHMCPAADNKWSELAMKECFYMTNICPQVHEMNAGQWENLETKCRQWAVADGTIIIVAGPILTDNLTETIVQAGVIVPERFFKVIISPYADPPRGIGFIINNGEVPGGLQACALTIDEVEQITGHDFFYALPDDIEKQIESQCNYTQWSAIH